MAERIGVEPIHRLPRVRFSKPLPYRSANAPRGASLTSKRFESQQEMGILT